MTGSCFPNTIALPHDPRDVRKSHKSQLTYMLKLRFRASDGSVLSLSFLPLIDLSEQQATVTKCSQGCPLAEPDGQ